MRNVLQTSSIRMSGWMEAIAGILLIGIMLLIGCDIVGRIFGCPVPGAYEIVSLTGGLILGLALPATSKANGHVSTDILLSKLSRGPRGWLVVATRFIGIAIFSLAGCGMIRMGIRLKEAGEVTAVLELPFYYIAYAMGSAFLIQSLVMFSEIMENLNRKSERDSV